MELKAKLKEYEGTKAYQTKFGYFKNDKFWVYKCSEGFPTIGYGHLVLRNEKAYYDGITEHQADLLLEQDIEIARTGVNSLKLNLPPESRWNEFLIMMIFQLGLAGTKQFKRFLAALSTGNYATAILEVKDSKWYRQTPNRVESMITYVVRG
ncbi:Phage-related lysozyme (muraminidase) [Yersinia pekkanenii]|uniref:Lysozyme n=1 Tax=Yersinia pekkanenii TaxID=1288385 RepID=A0A0T9PTB0_9GAMM|nr:glycoside hydrolase family protein [Yersinia pekkanenii]CNH80631.1 Phage-related lysozyme (muraminidase) [Yersinia pekkanenii]